MVTARSLRTPRIRVPAGLLHVLGLTLLLFGLLCAHGSGPHGSAHAATGTTAPAAQAAAAGIAAPASAAPADRHAPSHPVHDCAPVPHRAASPADATATPPAATLARPAPAVHRDTTGHPGPARHPAGAAPSAHPATSAVLQV